MQLPYNKHMLSYLKYIRSYEIIAFITGFALMAYELAASRILAPSIGSSTYVWTCVIGVIIAALSLGYAAGGVLADRRAKPHDIAWLMLASSFGVAITLTFAEGTLAMLEGLKDPRLQGVFASLLLFMPASFAIGTISPYLARLRTPALNQTGTSVALLSSANAVGGIAGTFCVGFVLFGYIGAMQTMALICLTLAVFSWVITPKKYWQKRVLLTLAMLIVVVVHFLPKNDKYVLATIDTPSSHYQVVKSTYANQDIIALTMGPGGSQSGVFANGSSDLVFNYTKQMAQIVLKSPKNKNILMLGGGAFTIPNYLATRTNSTIDVVEIDPQLTDIAKKYFNYSNHDNVKIINQDARAFLNTNQQKYDIILVDVYSDVSVPFSLATIEYAKQLKKSLTNDGIVAVNQIGGKNGTCGPLLSAIHSSYASSFKWHAALPQSTQNLAQTQNIVTTYSDKELSWIKNSQQLDQGQTLTDDFAPVEKLQQKCGV